MYRCWWPRKEPHITCNSVAWKSPRTPLQSNNLVRSATAKTERTTQPPDTLHANVASPQFISPLRCCQIGMVHGYVNRTHFLNCVFLFSSPRWSLCVAKQLGMPALGVSCGQWGHKTNDTRWKRDEAPDCSLMPYSFSPTCSKATGLRGIQDPKWREATPQEANRRTCLKHDPFRRWILFWSNPLIKSIVLQPQRYYILRVSTPMRKRDNEIPLCLVKRRVAPGSAFHSWGGRWWWDGGGYSLITFVVPSFLYNSRFQALQCHQEHCKFLS